MESQGNVGRVFGIGRITKTVGLQPCANGDGSFIGELERGDESVQCFEEFGLGFPHGAKETVFVFEQLDEKKPWSDEADFAGGIQPAAQAPRLLASARKAMFASTMTRRPLMPSLDLRAG